jgi:hypothetical protein
VKTSRHSIINEETLVTFSVTAQRSVRSRSVRRQRLQHPFVDEDLEVRRDIRRERSVANKEPEFVFPFALIVLSACDYSWNLDVDVTLPVATQAGVATYPEPATGPFRARRDGTDATWSVHRLAIVCDPSDDPLTAHAGFFSVGPQCSSIVDVEAWLAPIDLADRRPDRNQSRTSFALATASRASRSLNNLSEQLLLRRGMPASGRRDAQPRVLSVTERLGVTLDFSWRSPGGAFHRAH